MKTKSCCKRCQHQNPALRSNFTAMKPSKQLLATAASASTHLSVKAATPRSLSNKVQMGEVYPGDIYQEVVNELWRPKLVSGDGCKYVSLL